MAGVCHKILDIPICDIEGKPMHPFAYDYGERFCTHCDRVFVTEERMCPCCKLQLRVIPRGKKGKLDLRKRNSNETVRF